MSNGPSSVLSDLELSAIKVLEEITPWAILKHDVDVFWVLKHVNHSDDVGVLADLEHLYLPFLKL